MSDLPLPRDFPHGSHFKKREGWIVQVGDYTLRLRRVLRETYHDAYEFWKVIFEGDIISDQAELFPEPVILKFKYQLPPNLYPEEEWPFLHKKGRDFFLQECRAVKACQGSGHTPGYITQDEQRQCESTDPYPGGLIFILVETKLEGEQLLTGGFWRDPPLVLSVEEMHNIKSQIVETLEYCRQQGFNIGFEPEDTFYNKQTGRMHFVRMRRVSDKYAVSDRPITASLPELKYFWSMLPDEWWENDL